MKDLKAKKELKNIYSERDIIGGVFVIRNSFNDKCFLDATTDLRGIKNRFEFAQKTGSCVHMKLQDDWNKHGGDKFIFEVLEELKKSDVQTAEEFKTDIDLLKTMWLEKLNGKEFY